VRDDPMPAGARTAPAVTDTETDAAQAEPDQRIRALVARLGRPHASGGTVIERSALMAAGTDFNAAVAWILAHGGAPETAAPSAPRGGGLHGTRIAGSGRDGATSPPRRFVLPHGALRS
jgi:hypothetical protein